ncbi:hypothetical protein SELMODRAFT_405133 [Selaginella moellendorffii]|uniref:Uncharacterized protein n=2 Tax=Selaginella moellendorffii TaxID=88036 RepID=D8QYI3_SELML|nr:hypothetical protein SELMODRAFT_405133 [Selaginella moellendorffii]
MAVCLRKFLRFLNYFVMIGAIVSVAAIVAIRLSPTWAGWGFILVAALTFLSGLLGCFPFDSCFSYHFLALGLSMGGLGSGSLALFIKQELVEQHLKSKRSVDNTRILMRVDAILFMIMLCVQMMVLVLAFIVHHCSYENFYEDLESKNAHRAQELAKVQEEAEARSAKANDSHAAELNRKMREKYGKWTQDGDFSDRNATPPEADKV